MSQKAPLSARCKKQNDWMHQPYHCNCIETEYLVSVNGQATNRGGNGKHRELRQLDQPRTSQGIVTYKLIYIVLMCFDCS